MKNKGLIIGICILAVVLTAGAWFAFNQQDSVSKEDQNKQQKVNNNNLEESNLAWYEIPELGIKFPVDEEEKAQLVYKYKTWKYNDKEIEGAYFSSKDLEKAGGCCGSEYGPLGLIVKEMGKDQNAISTGYIEASNSMQFDDFYFQARLNKEKCSLDKGICSQQSVFDFSDKKTIYNSIKNIELIK